MRVLVTGARGKVGRAAADALSQAGHDVTATDVGRPEFERDLPGAPPYLQGDLTDAGTAFALVRGMDAVVHAAAIPDPLHHPPHVVFANNVTAAFNVVEACVRSGVRRLVNISSETVPGFFFPEREYAAEYCPVDEEHPIKPQDPYALAKHFGEQLCDAAVRRSDLRAITIRPSWVQWEGNYERNLGPVVRDPDEPSVSFWSYIDVYDLADAITLAVGSELAGHEVFYIASPDNAGGRDLAEHVRRHFGDRVPVRDLDRPDAGGISIAKARRLLGYDPTRSWRDYLTDDGRLRPEVAERLAP